MRQLDDTEDLIELASKLKHEAATLFDAYTTLGPLLDKELRAIKARDLALVTEIGAEKAAVAATIEGAFNGLRANGEKLARVHARAFDLDSARAAASLSDCRHLLAELASLVPTAETLAAQVLQHQVDGVHRLTAAFEAEVPRVKPKIEFNRILLQAMLESYQESCRFWQQVAEETAASYNAQGVQKAQGRTSAIRVGA